MEGPGSATIKYRSLSYAPRGIGNLSGKKPHINYDGRKIAFSSSIQTEIITQLKLAYK